MIITLVDGETVEKPFEVAACMGYRASKIEMTREDFTRIDKMAEDHPELLATTLRQLAGRFEMSGHEALVANQIDLVMTSGACPEQYDAMLDGEQVGYLRLRNGYFRVDYGYSGGETVYTAETIGDGLFDEDERDFHLDSAKRALAERIVADHTPGNPTP